MQTDWSAIITTLVIWIAAQGGLGGLASVGSEIFNGKIFPKLKRGWKIFLVVLVCLILSILEAISTKAIVLPIDLQDSVVVVGITMLIFAGSQVWWKKIINPKSVTKTLTSSPTTGPPEMKNQETFRFK